VWGKWGSQSKIRARNPTANKDGPSQSPRARSARPPAINAANHVAILIAGDAKAKILADILSAEKNAVTRYPIQQVDPTGQLDWYLDTAAAHLLNIED